ncbi:MAG: protein-methionine-sulfoxide reductase heme-binding subunit MsrQ [Sulfitobacter sp.]
MPVQDASSRRPNAARLIDLINQGARRVPVWPLYILGALGPVWLLYLAQTGGLGREPVKALEHELGALALKLLIAGLAITPLRRHLGVNLLKFRRAIGILAFCYVALHLAVWVLLDMSLLWAQMWADVIKRPYITVGMAGFALLIPLVATSNNYSLRKLGGARWRKLHKLTYGAVILGGVHFIWVAKGFQLEPLVYMAVILALLALRLPKRKAVRAR